MTNQEKDQINYVLGYLGTVIDFDVRYLLIKETSTIEHMALEVIDEKIRKVMTDLKSLLETNT